MELSSFGAVVFENVQTFTEPKIREMNCLASPFEQLPINPRCTGFRREAKFPPGACSVAARPRWRNEPSVQVVECVCRRSSEDPEMSVERGQVLCVVCLCVRKCVCCVFVHKSVMVEMRRAFCGKRLCYDVPQYILMLLYHRTEGPELRPDGRQCSRCECQVSVYSRRRPAVHTAP